MKLNRLGHNPYSAASSNESRRNFNPVTYEISSESRHYQSNEFASTRNENHYKCPYCFQITLSRTLLQKHMSAHHGDQMPFSCSLCTKGFYTQSGLSRHIEDHGSLRFSCHVCDLQLKRKQYLVSHLKAVHKLLLCTYCSSHFSTKEELNAHILHCGK